ncbi:hypothetical protein [Tunturiibacter gelidiferens]|uniref:hypothetical protein n=1 Tax=Tunturiibacter gelidiferens TaxID=3069689 RepID=UPI003D9BBA08
MTASETLSKKPTKKHAFLWIIFFETLLNSNARKTMPTLKNINVNMDAKAIYFAELLARMQRKTFKKYISDLVDTDLAQYEFNNELWAEHPADRLALLGNRMPQLLNTRQRILWIQVICADQMFWRVPLTGKPLDVNADTFNFPLLREVWSALNRNQDAVMEQANARMGQLDIQIRRISKE